MSGARSARPDRPGQDDLPACPDLPGWNDLPFWTSGWPQVRARLRAERREVLPPPDRIFAAFAIPPDAVRVVILGQDPYPTPGHAMGLAFGVAPGLRPLPRSLSNIFKELESDLHVIRTDGDLSGWAAQGVFLLNTALTCPAGVAGGHGDVGWRDLARQVLARLDDRPRAAVLWGRPAQTFRPLLTHPGHLVITSPHPSPLSARRGFFGSRPFGRINAWLVAQGQAPIDWAA